MLGDAIIDVFIELFRTKCVRTATFIAIFSDFCYFEIKPEMRDVPTKMRECGKSAKMRDFPHDCGTVDTYVKVGMTRKPRPRINRKRNGGIYRRTSTN